MENSIEYKNKYLKYKNKYLELKKKQQKQEGGAPKLLLNNSSYVDMLNLNNANIYTINKNGIELDVILLDKSSIMYRGFNVPCGILSIYPGSPLNKFNYEPIWFAGPEVVVIYCARNLTNTMLQRFYSNLMIKIDTINVAEMKRLYETVLLTNISSILAYSPLENVELIDVNNIKNLKNLITLFRQNFSKNNYKEFLKLKRIPDKVKTLIGEQLLHFNTSLPINKYNKIENDPKLNNESKKIYNKIGTIIEWGFRAAFCFGKFYSFKTGTFIERIYPKKFTGAIIQKYRDTVKPATNKAAPYFNVSNLYQLRKNTTSRFNETNEKIINDKIDTMNKKWSETYEKFIQETKDKIAKERKRLDDIAISRKEQFKNTFLTQNETARQEIMKIKAGTSVGYVVDLDNDSMIGFKKVSEPDTYQVYFFYNKKDKIFTNPSTMKTGNTDNDKAMEACKLCRLARTSDWINEKDKDNLTHLNGLSNNMTYFEYNSNTDKVEPIGSTFQQLYGKNMDKNGEERVLAIPFNHIGTMNHHPDCNLSSGIFPPNGSYHMTNKTYDCGALIYKNSKNAEVIKNLFGTHDSALTYAYIKSGGKDHKLAELNYDDYSNSKFYKFKNPISNSEPKIYLYFHIKANSEPHLHMHTFLDSNGTNLNTILESSRIKINGVSINNNDIMEKLGVDPANFILFSEEDKDGDKDGDKLDTKDGEYEMYGGSVVSELFGSPDYDEFKNCPTSIITDTGKKIKLKVVECTGPRKADETTVNPTQNKPGEWSDIFNIKSTIYDSSYKYHHSGSFEYLLKSILGFEDDTDDEINKRMKHKYIFKTPNYDLHKDLYFDEHKMFDDLVTGFTKDYLAKKFEETSKGVYPTEFYKDYNRPILDIPSTRTDIFETKYGPNDDEQHIIRESTTINDSLAMVLMQFALMDMPNIGGYYGNSAPLFNKWRNVTHTEIGLFNSLDYPLKLIKNAKYATCNHDNLTEQFKKEIFFAVFLNIRYHKESQLAFVPTDSDPNIYVERNIINDFMSSDKKKLAGGRNPIITGVPIQPILMNQNIKEVMVQNPPVPVVAVVESKTKFTEAVETFNNLFSEYAVDPKDQLIQSIFDSIHYNMIPTSGQLEDLEIKKIDNKTVKQC